MLNSSKLYLYTLLCNLLPQTRLFSFKAWLLRWCGASVGKNVRICSSVKISGSGELIIGDNTWIGAETMISSGAKIEIGRNVDIGPLVYIGTGSHEINHFGCHVAGKGYNGNIIIRDGAWLGARSVILPSEKNTERIIGEKCVIAAGSVVVSDISSSVIAAGVPARAIRNIHM